MMSGDAYLHRSGTKRCSLFEARLQFAKAREGCGVDSGHSRKDILGSIFTHLWPLGPPTTRDDRLIELAYYLGRPPRMMHAEHM